MKGQNLTEALTLLSIGREVSSYPTSRSHTPTSLAVGDWGAPTLRTPSPEPSGQFTPLLEAGTPDPDQEGRTSGPLETRSMSQVWKNAGSYGQPWLVLAIAIGAIGTGIVCHECLGVTCFCLRRTDAKLRRLGRRLRSASAPPSTPVSRHRHNRPTTSRETASQRTRRHRRHSETDWRKQDIEMGGMRTPAKARTKAVDPFGTEGVWMDVETYNKLVRLQRTDNSNQEPRRGRTRAPRTNTGEGTSRGVDPTHSSDNHGSLGRSHDSQDGPWPVYGNDKKDQEASGPSRSSRRVERLATSYTTPDAPPPAYQPGSYGGTDYCGFDTGDTGGSCD